MTINNKCKSENCHTNNCLYPVHVQKHQNVMTELNHFSLHMLLYAGY